MICKCWWPMSTQVLRFPFRINEYYKNNCLLFLFAIFFQYFVSVINFFLIFSSIISEMNLHQNIWQATQTGTINYRFAKYFIPRHIFFGSLTNQPILCNFQRWKQPPNSSAQRQFIQSRIDQFSINRFFEFIGRVTIQLFCWFIFQSILKSASKIILLFENVYLIKL